MKKNYLFLVALLLFSVIGFTGCSDDDDSVDASALLGEWQSTYEYAYETEGGEMYPLEDGPYTDEVWTFYEDGTMYWYDNSDNDGVYCDWSVSGNKLYLTDQEDHVTDEYVIESINGSEMVISYTERDGDYMLYDRITFRKVE